MKENTLLLGLFFTSIIIFLVIPSAQGSNDVKIFPPNTKPYDISYEEHVKNYWKWIISFPASNSPYTDDTGERCALGQNDSNSSVFYLVGAGGGQHYRTCKVPEGKGIFIPVLNVEVSDKEQPNDPSPEALSRAATNDQNLVGSLYLEINGQKIIDEFYLRGVVNEKNTTASKYRIHTDVFEIEFPESAKFGDALYDVKVPGKSKAVADGFYLITEPLKKGEYNVIFKGTILCPDLNAGECIGFAQDMNYKLIVE